MSPVHLGILSLIVLLSMIFCVCHCYCHDNHRDCYYALVVSPRQLLSNWERMFLTMQRFIHLALYPCSVDGPIFVFSGLGRQLLMPSMPGLGIFAAASPCIN